MYSEIPPDKLPEVITLWLVEDDVRYRQTLEAFLNHAGDITCTAAFSSCEEVLETFHNLDSPDVMLLDIGLPGMNGIEGLKRIKALTPRTEVIMLTVHEKNDAIFEAICLGASGYLLKDASGEDVARAVRDARKGGAPMNAQIARKVLTMFAHLDTPSHDYELTTREREILRLMVEGSSMKQIAAKLNVSYYTIDSHQKNIYLKLQVHSRSGAVAKVLKEHLV